MIKKSSGQITPLLYLYNIINLNYDMFDNIISVAKELDDEAFANTLDNSIRLKLYDRSPEDKLLGIQIK